MKNLDLKNLDESQCLCLLSGLQLQQSSLTVTASTLGKTVPGAPALSVGGANPLADCELLADHVDALAKACGVPSPVQALVDKELNLRAAVASRAADPGSPTFDDDMVDDPSRLADDLRTQIENDADGGAVQAGSTKRRRKVSSASTPAPARPQTATERCLAAKGFATLQALEKAKAAWHGTGKIHREPKGATERCIEMRRERGLKVPDALIALLLGVLLVASARVQAAGLPSFYTNALPQLSTNSVSARPHVSLGNVEDVCLTASAVAQLSGSSPALGKVDFVFKASDGTSNVFGPEWILAVPLTGTNGTMPAVTNWAVGAVPQIRLTEIRHTSTDCYVTNIALRFTTKSKGVIYFGR